MIELPHFPIITAGVTCSSPTYLLEELHDFTKNKLTDFNHINRNPVRYEYLGSLLTRPTFKNLPAIYIVNGDFYRVINPENENGICFKQDFTVYNTKSTELKFVRSVKFQDLFPELQLNHEYLWDYSKFQINVAKGKHYQGSHHIKHDDMPFELLLDQSHNTRLCF